MSEYTEVYNRHVVMLAGMCNDYIEELVRSASANLNEFMAPDIERLLKGLTDLEGWIEWMHKSEHKDGDFPQTHAIEQAVPVSPNVPELNDRLVTEAIGQLTDLRDEGLRSESKRRKAGCSDYDYIRWISYITSARSYVTDYVQQYTPTDKPDFPHKVPMVVEATAKTKK